MCVACAAGTGAHLIATGPIDGGGERTGVVRTGGDVQRFQSRCHNLQMVVYLEPHIYIIIVKDVFAVPVPSPLETTRHPCLMQVHLA